MSWSVAQVALGAPWGHGPAQPSGGKAMSTSARTKCAMEGTSIKCAEFDKTDERLARSLAGIWCKSLSAFGKNVDEFRRAAKRMRSSRTAPSRGNVIAQSGEIRDATCWRPSRCVGIRGVLEALVRTAQQLLRADALT
jgi:hypothetical protein